jgi:hypothetical protein
MAERFSDIEKPFVIHQPSLEERLKEYPELKAKIGSMLAIISNAGGDVEKRPNPRDGLSRNCARRETKFSQLGPPSAAEARKRNTTPSRR